MQKQIRGACALAILAVAVGCASKPATPNPSQAGKGSRVVDAVVVDRRYEPPTSGSGYRSSGTYFLSFEARDGEATVHYEFPVTRQQYSHYAEGSHVQLIMSNDELRDIRPVP
ncbi:MAG TPA: hypothetical protein VJA66_07475 [Thermoanaerobaculia bacterium]